VKSITPYAVSSQSGNELGEQDKIFWKYYNDTGMKFGWILNVKDDELKSIQNCKSKYHELNHRQLSKNREISSQNIKNKDKTSRFLTMCKNFTMATQISFKVVFSTSPVLQVSYLKSYDAAMGSVYLWLDDDVSIFVELSGRWDDPYSITHYTTISPSPLTNISTYAVGEWKQLRTMTSGEHLVNIGGVPFKQEHFKWKLYSLISC
jgi:hypothetical protein